MTGLTGFEALGFERACPTGLRSRRPPNLGLLAQGPAGVVAVESKLTEPLQPTTPLFSPPYAEQIRDERRAGVWFRAIRTVRARPDGFSSLDVARVIKHAFGLARCFKEQRTTLPYLYREPDGAEHEPILLAHRREIGRFARMSGRRLSCVPHPELSGPVGGLAAGGEPGLARGARREPAGAL